MTGRSSSSPNPAIALQASGRYGTAGRDAQTSAVTVFPVQEVLIQPKP